MDIKDLDKKQLILLTLLITFIVSIATGIVTVSLMNKMPAKATQTINNVIQRTIEKVTTTTPASTTTTTTSDDSKYFGQGNVLVDIYSASAQVATPSTLTTPTSTATTTGTTNGLNISEKPLGQGVIVSDVGLILVDSGVLTEATDYSVSLGDQLFEAKVLKKFSNGFSIIVITPKNDSTANKNTVSKKAVDSKTLTASAADSTQVDKTQQ